VRYQQIKMTVELFISRGKKEKKRKEKKRKGYALN
jgi:hypothetical protein